jgi:hypothetical protein
LGKLRVKWGEYGFRKKEREREERERESNAHFSSNKLPKGFQKAGLKTIFLGPFGTSRTDRNLQHKRSLEATAHQYPQDGLPSFTCLG